MVPLTQFFWPPPSSTPASRRGLSPLTTGLCTGQASSAVHASSMSVKSAGNLRLVAPIPPTAQLLPERRLVAGAGLRVFLRHLDALSGLSLSCAFATNGRRPGVTHPHETILASAKAAGGAAEA